MTAGAEISKHEIREELEGVLSAQRFIKSPILSRFLQFVVEKSLDGHANQIKEYTVGLAVLNKPHSFNPQTDASVRIAAIRLRKLLDEHYQENGNAAGVRIQLLKGSYSPVFSKGQSVSDAFQPLKKTTAQKFPTDSICVLPFTGLHLEKSGDFSIEGFSAYLSEKLSLFQDIQVKAYSSVSNYLNGGGSLEKLGPALKVTYYLSGSIEIDGQRILVSVHLFEAASNTLIWSQDFQDDGAKDSLSNIMEQITSKIVASLAGYSGLIHYKKFSSGPGNFHTLSNSQANAVFWFYHFQTKLSESIFREALQQLTKVTEENPDCDLCWAVLAHLYAHSIVYNYSSGTDNPLGRAQAFLSRAFALNPNSQQGHITLAWICIFMKDKNGAEKALEKADQINPNSSYAKAVCSLGMSFLGEYEKADDLLEQAIPLNPLPYWWFNLPIIFRTLKTGDYERMLFYARKIGTPAGTHEHVFEMIALFYLDDLAALKKVLSAYLEKYPGGIEHAQSAWPKILFDEVLVGKITFALDEINKLKVSAPA